MGASQVVSGCQQLTDSVSFDDGPTEFTPRILAILEKNNAKATFFCIGKHVMTLIGGCGHGKSACAVALLLPSALMPKQNKFKAQRALDLYLN